MSLPLTVSRASIHGHSHTFILLHDRGGSGQQIDATFDNGSNNTRNNHLRDTYPAFRWVFPSAKGKEKQWFNCTATASDNAGVLRDNVGHILRILKVEAGRLQGQHDRIILAGIGQGAVLAAHVLLVLAIPPESRKDDGVRRNKLGAFIALSSSEMPFPGEGADKVRHLLGYPEEVDYEMVRGTPMLLQNCGEQDAASVGALRDLLCGAGARSITERSLAEGNEVLSRESMENMVQFLNREVRWTPEAVFQHGRLGSLV